MTMEFLYRNAPAYKGSQAQPTKRTGLLAELGSTIGGGGMPAYRTLDGASAQAPASSRSWWQAFAVTPSYKTADHVAPGEPPPDGGDGDEAPAGECSETATQVVIL
jgi:hypothetical protein